MKIVISGSAGTGKTTLARALSEQYGYDHIPEGYDVFFEENGEFIQPAERLKNLILSVLEDKHKQENKAGDFVSDRCPVDLFNLWLSRGFSRYQDETTHLYRVCRSYIENYDAVIVLPWGAFPIQQVETIDQPRRVMNPWIQFQNHATIVGLITQWVPPERVLPIPRQLISTKLRINYVVKNLTSRA